MSVEDVERKSGLQLFHRKIHREYIPFLCNETSCELTGRDTMPPETLEQVNFTQKIRRCKSLDQLKQLWMEVENKQYKRLDNMLKTAYTKKLDELSQQTTISNT